MKPRKRRKQTYWELLAEVAKEVAKWPKWKRSIKIGYEYSCKCGKERP